MSLSVVAILCIGLAVYGWVTLFCRSLDEHEHSTSRRQQYILFAVLIAGVLLSVVDTGRATNPFVLIK